MLNTYLKIGDRITVTYATVLDTVEYQGTDFLNNKVQYYWRTTVKDIDGNCFVFTGKRCDVKKGDIIDLRGTVKKFNNKYKSIRLNRVRITEIHSSMWKGNML